MRAMRWLGLVLVLSFAAGRAPAVSIFSEGMLTPETISQAPAGFGSFGGYYLVPDAARGLSDAGLHNVWTVPAAGGAPTLFSGGHADFQLSGLFLPTTWGAYGGQYLTVGRDATQTIGTLYAYDHSGARALFGEYAGTPFTQALMAPDAFTGWGGKLVAAESENGGGVYAIRSDGVLETLALSVPVTQPFGLAFAPEGFGAAGGKLLVSDAIGGGIVALDTAGNATPFATVTLLQDQVGLRQLEFAPKDFLLDALGISGDLLLVSVSGSTNGGGTLGDVLAIDVTGAVVASLQVREVLGKFDPRGMLFTDAGLLISDASDPIVLVDAGDFRPGRLANVPAPSVLVLLAIGLVGIGGARVYPRHA